MSILEIVVERFHITLKDLLYSLYFEENNKLNLKDCLEIVLKKYNNHLHSATKMTPNKIFYSRSEDLFVTVLNNIKNSFKNVGKDFYNFSKNEKVLLNPKFIIKKNLRMISLVI